LPAKSDVQIIVEVLEALKGHPNFVIANRIIDELAQREKKAVRPKNDQTDESLPN
jgi:hypothetical protein